MIEYFRATSPPHGVYAMVHGLWLPAPSIRLTRQDPNCADASGDPQIPLSDWDYLSHMHTRQNVPHAVLPQRVMP